MLVHCAGTNVSRLGGRLELEDDFPCMKALENTTILAAQAIAVV